MTQNNKTVELEKRIIDLEAKLEDLTQKVSNFIQNSDFGMAIPKNRKKMSAKEFLLAYKVSTSIQKTLLFCYFLENYVGFLSFNTVDLENVFRQAKEPLPKNINDMINKNIAKGFLMDVPELKEGKKAWVVTASGERFIEEGIKNE